MSLLSSRARLVLFAVACGPLGVACGSDAPAGLVGGAVADGGDMHCMPNGTLAAQPVGMCLSDNADGGQADDGGADAAPASTIPDYGATLYGSEGYDDDCKYHVSWTSTPIRKDASVTFTVTVEQLDPAGPATGADVSPEVFLTPTHPSLSRPTTTETPAGSGVYKIGPVVFNASGLWTVRFHMYEVCSDSNEDSPHGHAAFYVQVP